MGKLGTNDKGLEKVVRLPESLDADSVKESIDVGLYCLCMEGKCECREMTAKELKELKPVRLKISPKGKKYFDFLISSGGFGSERELFREVIKVLKAQPDHALKRKL